jgi:N-hydroxyarylamine O-acetyltransferase
MDFSLYLDRIGYCNSLAPEARTLRRLHLAHLRTVPFENLDIGLGRPLSLDLEALFDKIVVRRRGGFCYELNGLFAWLLEQLGFSVTRLSARDLHPDGSWSPEFDHLVLLVRCPGDPMVRWLADVGYGDSFLEPLMLDEAGEQVQGQRTYRIAPEQGYRFVWQRQAGETWVRLFGFTLLPHRLDEFGRMCVYHQTSPESIFTQKRVCTLATPFGRITLSGDRFITTVDGVRQEQPIEDEQTFRQILRDRFWIEL